MSALPPAPESWVAVAKQLPLTRLRLEEIVARAREDEEFRRRVVAEPERVLEEADVVAHSINVELIRERLDEKSDD